MVESIVQKQDSVLKPEPVKTNKLLSAKLGSVVRHIITVLKKLPRGAVRQSRLDFSLEVPFQGNLSREWETLRLAVVCHIFYADTVPELISYIKNVPSGTDIYISTDTEEKERIIRSGFSRICTGKLDVRIVPNVGRDIAPKYVTFCDVYGSYDLLLFLHGKKTVFFKGGGDAWRKHMLECIAGSAVIINDIIELFSAREDIGVVIPQHFGPIRKYVSWNGCYFSARALAKKMGIQLSLRSLVSPIDFAAGSMFWARPAALRPILDLKLNYCDFPPEGGQRNGTIAHALERLLLYSCEHAGFIWLKTSTNTSDCGKGQVSNICTKKDLDEHILYHSFELIKKSP